jgi:hypothetical protein
MWILQAQRRRIKLDIPRSQHKLVLQNEQQRTGYLWTAQVDKVPISPTFYVQRFYAKLFFAYILGLNFFWRKNIGANALKKLAKLTNFTKI